MDISVKEFNKLYPPGTPVHIKAHGQTRRFTIRSSAINHSCGKPQVWVNGVWGSVALEDITIAKELIKQD